MIKHILIFESDHYQALFPLTRFRGSWDIPSGIFSLRELLTILFPKAKLHFAPIEGREYLIQNPLSGTVAFDERGGSKANPGKLLQAEQIKDGEMLLVIHAGWVDRNLLSKIAQNSKPGIYSSIKKIPLLAVFDFNRSYKKNNFWQDIENKIDPLPQMNLSGEKVLQYPWEILDLFEKNINKDAALLKENRFISPPLPGITGLRKNIHLHPSVRILPGVELDASKGAIIIDHGTVISGPTKIEGPIYIGPNNNVDGAKLRGNSYFGHTCKIAGEIENSLVMDFTNKHHDGFLGHSIVGSWVNWGSLANTSDLKNNYGIIRMWNKGILKDTGKIKLGSVVADFVKFAIGIQINTGTVVDVGANVFGENITRKYVEGFSWGSSGKKYEIEKFLQDSEKIMKRRKQKLIEPLKDQLRETFKALTVD